MRRLLFLIGVFGFASFLKGQQGSSPTNKGLKVAPQVMLPVELAIDKATRVRSSRIYLGEIGHCQSVGTLCDEVSGVDFGPSPHPGKSIRLKCRFFRKILEEELGGRPFLLTCPDSIKISSLSEVPDIVELRNLLRQKLASIPFLGPHRKMDLRDVSLINNPRIRPGHHEYSFDALSRVQSLIQLRQFLGKPLEVTATSMAGDEFESRFLVRAKISRSEPKIFYTRSLQRGERISKADLVEEWVDVPRFSKAASLDSLVGHLVGKILVKDVSGGDEAVSKHARRVFLVKRGDLVKIKIINGSVILYGRAKALGKGSKGSIVDVQFRPTRKTLKSRVIDRGLVEVHL